MHLLDYDYTDKDISPWGGLRLVQEMLERIGLQKMLSQCGLPDKGSNRSYESATIVEGFLVSVILGAKRLSHSGNVGSDKVLREIFNWKKGMATQSTFCRFFNRFSLEENDRIMSSFNRLWFDKLGLEKHTVDVDSSVISRYGEQEGVEVGYNPRKMGRGSHHPIIAFSAEAKMVIQAWMRSGDSASCTQFDEFMDEVLSVLPREKVGLVRADSGFYGNEHLKYLENKNLNYIISCKMHTNLQSKIFANKSWQRIKHGISVSSFAFQSGSWEHARRIVVVRKDSGQLPKSGGKTLFPEYEEFAQYRYTAFVTNMDLSAELIWEIYKKRGDAENQIKELKYEYGMEGFCSKSLAATESAFRWVMVAYNLMSLFKQKIMPEKAFSSHSTVKFKCIALGSYIVKDGRSLILKLAVKNKKRDYIDLLFVNLAKLNNEFG